MIKGLCKRGFIFRAKVCSLSWAYARVCVYIYRLFVSINSLLLLIASIVVIIVTKLCSTKVRVPET